MLISHIDIMKYTVCTFLLVICMANAVIGKTQEQCETECIEECHEECPEKKVCTEDQLDCGEGPPHPSPLSFCEPDRICVANTCQCRLCKSS